MDRGQGPLWSRAPQRLAHELSWGALVLSALTLLAAAAAAAPLFLAAAGDAAMTSSLRAVPPHAPAAQAAVVRLNSGSSPEDELQAALLARLGRIPGLARPTLSAASVGRELLPAEATFRPYVSTGGPRVGARLFGQEDPAASLVPARGSSAAGSGAGVWLPQPVADQLHVSPGQTVTVGVVLSAGATRAPVRLAGVYQVADDGRRPLDPAGSTRWAGRAGLLPVDPARISRQSYLVVADTATVQQLADKAGDTLLWSALSALDPTQPTLAEAQHTADGVAALQRDLLDPTRVGILQGPLRPTLVSGLPGIVDQARSASGATVERTRSVGWAGIVLGLTAVLAVAVLTASRRRRETRHAIGAGLRPASLGGLAALELLPAAVLAWALGVAAASAVVSVWGPPATQSGDAVRTAVVQAGLACLAGVGLVALTAVAVAALAARAPSASVSAQRRTVPWEAGLAIVAATATAGLLGHARSDTGPLELLVPLLVVAATGALAGRGVVTLLARISARRAGRAGPATPGAAQVAAPRGLRAPTIWLAVRRAAAPGAERVLMVMLLTTGLGMLLYSATAASAVRSTTEDRVAALSGTRASGQVDGSWLLDPSAPAAPKPVDPGFSTPLPRPALPVARQPQLPHGDTVVWRTTVEVPGQLTNLPVLVIDPASFDAAASWGSGPELASARTWLPSLARGDTAVAARVRSGDATAVVPALLVGDTQAIGRAATATSSGLRAGDRLSVSGGTWNVPVRLLDTAPTFPGFDSTTNFVTLVVPADAFFTHLGAQDPRYAPRPDQSASDQFSTWVWSAAGVPGLDAVLGAHDVTAVSTRTEAAVRERPEFVAARHSLGYLLALGVGTAGLAVVGLGLFADRSAARSRASDLMLARAGMGRVRTRRSHLVELGVLVLTATVAAAVGVLLIARLGPVGLDPSAIAAPALQLRLRATGLTVLLVAAVACAVVGAAATRGKDRADEGGRVLRADG